MNETLQVRCVLDLLTAVPRSYVCCDDVDTVYDANDIEIRQRDQRAADAVMRNGVVVEVGTNVWCLADLDFGTLVRGKSVVRQGNQHASLVLEGLTNCP